MGYSKKAHIALWIAQWLVGLFFILASGAPKLLLPPEMLPMAIPLPAAFITFIGVSEVLGGLGLILPGLFRIRTGLTPLAGVGLIVVTVSATVYNLAAGLPGSALFAATLGLIVAGIAYARWRLAPLASASRQPALGAAK